MLIAIDFDDTLTADAELWRDCIAKAISRGHRVICVTARRDTDDNRETIDSWMAEHGIELYTYYTGLASKVDHMQRIGVKVDIWIDDDPRKCALGH
jgi:hypothetical protein